MRDWVATRAFEVVGRERLRELSQRSDRKGWIKVISHLAAIGGSAVSLSMLWESTWWFAPFLAHGVLLNCLYAGQHELSHWTVFQTRRLNDLWGHVFGFMTLNPFLCDRWAHFAHHRNTQNPDLDPELMGRPAYTVSSYLADLSGLNFWYRRVLSIGNTALGDLNECSWLSAKQKRTVTTEARVVLCLYGLLAAGSVAIGSWALAQFWLLPLLSTKWFHQLQNTGEHVGMPLHPDTLSNSRTLTGPSVMRWLMWNMSYHTAHHTFPGVPFHRLPQLHEEILRNAGEEIRSTGYVAAQVEIFRGLFRKSYKANWEA